jgi:hypothetical protein
MNDKHRRRYERGRRVDVFLNTPSEDFPDNSKGAVLDAHLKELLAQAAALGVERIANTSKRRQGTRGREEARTALRRMLKSVWDTFKAITLDRPDLKGLIESPIKSKTDQALVTAARAYADAAATHAALFAEYGLAAAFFNDLRSTADALESYIALQNAGVSEGVDTTAAIEEKLRQVDEVVERLDPIVRNKYRDDPAKLAAWESASHVERAPRRKPEVEETAPTPTPPANG